MKLTDQQKRFIVQGLARWMAPQQVADLVTEEWPEAAGHIDRRQVYKYDPTGARCEVAKKWQDLFWETREKFKAATEEISVAQPAYRLRVLADMVDRALAARNMVLVAQFLEQAAKETGGMFTNRRQVTLDGNVGVLRVPAEVDPDKWAEDAARYNRKIRSS